MCSTIHQLTHNFCFPMFLYLQSITTTNPSSNLSQWCKCQFSIGVLDTLSDSIQCLNFAKKIIHSIFDSILLYPRFKINSGNSIQKIIRFNSRGMINTGRIGKVPKNWPESVQNRQKRGLIIKNGKYRFKNWVIHSFHNKIQFKGLFNIIFPGIFNSKNFSIIFFPGKFNSKIYPKFLIWLDSIQ